MQVEIFEPQCTQMLMADLFSATPSYENNIGKRPLEPIRASNLFSRQRALRSGLELPRVWTAQRDQDVWDQLQD